MIRSPLLPEQNTLISLRLSVLLSYLHTVIIIHIGCLSPSGCFQHRRLVPDVLGKKAEPLNISEEMLSVSFSLSLVHQRPFWESRFAVVWKQNKLCGGDGKRAEPESFMSRFSSFRQLRRASPGFLSFIFSDSRCWEHQSCNGLQTSSHSHKT